MLEVALEDYTVKETFFLFELGGVDIILGVVWLAKLGDVRINWKTLSMSFMDQGRMVRIRGDPSMARKIVKPQSLKKEKEITTVSICWKIEKEDFGGMETMDEELTLQQRGEIKEIIKDNKEVFVEPKGLPPRRTINHKISLKEGVEAINVRSCRYPHLMKTEIEKQVSEILKAGIIRSSNNPFSSPVILVKKKDGS